MYLKVDVCAYIWSFCSCQVNVLGWILLFYNKIDDRGILFNMKFISSSKFSCDFNMYNVLL